MAVKSTEKIFKAPVNPAVLAQAVRVYLSNQRKARAKTKTRAEVAKTTAKMYRQKGTGRARHGAYSAPIFVGGGIAHGPDGRQNYHRKLTKALTRTAIQSALSDRAEGKNIQVMASIQEKENFAKTGKAQEWLVKSGLTGTRVLLITTKEEDKLFRGFRNLDNVTMIHYENLSAYQILKHQKLIASAEAMKEITNKYA